MEIVFEAYECERGGSNPVKALFGYRVCEEAAAGLASFKERHAGCGGGARAVDELPGEHYTYFFIPTSLGGAVGAQCACGGRWMASDLGFGEIGAGAE